jgi:hypothetical protein
MRIRWFPFAVALALAVVTSLPAPAKDVYKAYLDPAIPAHKAALDTLEKLKENPKDPALHNDLGCLIARDGFWKDALGEFDEAARLDKKFGKPLFNAGLVYAARGEWHSARRSFKRAVDRDRGNWTAWWMLGFAEEQLGNVNAAVDAYGRSLRVDTGLFDVARNPWAADTKLKARVLLETYPNRLALAALPSSEQIEQPARLATFFQRSGPPRVTVSTAVSAEPLPTPEAPAPAQSGPVVTSAPGPGSPTTTRPGAAVGSPASGDRIQFRPVPPRPAQPQRVPPQPQPAVAEPPVPQQPDAQNPDQNAPAMGPGGAFGPPRRRTSKPNPAGVAPVPPTPEPTPEDEQQQ